MLPIHRNNAPTVKLKLTREMVFQRSLMSDHKVSVTNYQTPKILYINIVDYITYKGVNYKINKLPSYSKVEHTTNHSYDITFEHPVYSMYYKTFRFEGQSVFPFYGVPSQLITFLVENMNSVDTGWSVGVVDNVGEKSISFEGVSCRAALSSIAEEFGMEYFLDGNGKRINLVQKVGIDTDITLEYGKGKGLYNLTRTSIEDQDIITRMYGQWRYII